MQVHRHPARLKFQSVRPRRVWGRPFLGGNNLFLGSVFLELAVERRFANP